MAGLHVTRFADKIFSRKLFEQKIRVDFLFWPPFKTKKFNLLTSMSKLTNLLWSRAIMALDTSKMIAIVWVYI